MQFIGNRLLFLTLALVGLAPAHLFAQSIVVNEVAWMGTSANTADEWIELHNYGSVAVNLTGWTLNAADGTPSITLSGTIAAGGYFLLERTDDGTVPGVSADQIYSGAMGNTGEDLVLRDGSSNQIDRVDAWHAGDNTSKASMSRKSSLVAGTTSSNWQNGTAAYTGGLGTPRAANQGIVINEIAWMGTTANANDEWLELFNPGTSAVSLSGWTLSATDGTPSISLSGSISAGGYLLLERTDDNTVPGVSAGLIYTGAMSNSGEVLELRDGQSNLIDRVDAWHSGNNTTKATMSRVTASAPGDVSNNWFNATANYSVGLGTPGVSNYSTGGTSYTDTWYSVYFTDHLNTTLPGTVGPLEMGQALVDAIDNATDTIEFAAYGFGGSGEVIEALANAVGRGVIVRGVVDSNASGYYPYYDTDTLIAALPVSSVIQDDDDRIMHNKFFIFDERYVWTGSANVSDTGLYAEYNSNWSILIDHAGLAAEYLTEFEEMFAGDFHTDKTDNTQHTFATLADGSIIESYFAPTDDAETNAIIRAIDEANTSLDIRIFFFTDAEIADAVIDAHDRGVTVRVILDAASAENEYSIHETLRAEGIPVKIENWGGKEHMKALAADGEVVILGSQNWTDSGNTASDENTLYIRNALLAQAFIDDFEIYWAAIPNTWLAGNPGAESVNSTGSLTDFIDNDHDGLTDEGAPEQLNTVSTASGAINVYFNKSAMVGYSAGSDANYHVNLETRLINRINSATSSIDLATYSMNLPDMLDALIDRADDGLDVRVIADSKDYAEGESGTYDTFVLFLERMARGLDGTPGTADDISVFADSPIFAVLDTTKRAAQGLPSTPTGFSYQTLTVGTNSVSGYPITLGELKNTTDYYSPGPQMHNKFAIFDGTWVWTGSWNFTVNGLYGSDANRLAGILGGNTNNGIEINDATVAGIYTTEFEEMWGSSSNTPDPATAAFHGRKTDNTTHVVTVGGKTVEIYFSPGDEAMTAVADYVADEADLSAYFNIFAWSDQVLTDVLKVKYEGSDQDLTGTLTGFDVRGVFESSYWNMWWSASVDMTGRTATQTSTNNPNTRWANPAPVFRMREDLVLHHKYMIIDGHSTSDPAVITGSTNWSANGDDTNDENLLIIHDGAIADQFMQEFYARYYQASGILP